MSAAKRTEAAEIAMTIHFFSKSETHRELANFAPFGIDLDSVIVGED